MRKAIWSTLRALPAARIPGLIEIARVAAKLGADREFHAGLDIVMAGLAERRPQAASRKA